MPEKNAEDQPYRYFAIHKPYGILSQFTDPSNKKNTTLREIPFEFPGDAYAVGRLDKDSEGLLLITNDKSINRRLLHPSNQHEREYWVQIHGMPDEEGLNLLRSGLTLSINNEPFKTRPAKAKILDPQPEVAPRVRRISPRGERPVVWISMTLIEGKNRQVRRMTAMAGYPTLRLIRYRIENIDIKDLKAGEVREFEREEFFTLLNLD